MPIFAPALMHTLTLGTLLASLTAALPAHGTSANPREGESRTRPAAATTTDSARNKATTHKATTNKAAPKKAAASRPAGNNRKKADRPLRWPETGATQSYARREAVLAWGQDMAARQGLDAEQVKAVLRQAWQLPTVQQLVLPPATPQAKNWAAYRERFIEPRRIQAGVRFWQRHREALRRAEAQYGVPAAMVVGIIGVETLYGENTGRFRVVDALSTLAFDFPAAHPRAGERQRYFQGELEQFLRMTLAAGMDPLQVRGSYAGAMGLPQFMPSSWVRHAVDFDGDGRIDLFGSPSDAIGSVARYFQAHQWQTGQPTHYPVTVVPGQTDLDTLLAPDILPTFSAAAMHERGALLGEAARQHTGPLALVELRNADQPPSYVAGTDNFYVVTRYNWSSYYAMAVIELAEALTRAMERQP